MCQFSPITFKLQFWVPKLSKVCQFGPITLKPRFWVLKLLKVCQFSHITSKLQFWVPKLCKFVHLRTSACMTDIYDAFCQMSPLYVFTSPKMVHTLPCGSVCCNLCGHELKGSFTERFVATDWETLSQSASRTTSLSLVAAAREIMGQSRWRTPSHSPLSLMTSSLPRHPCRRVGRAGCCLGTSMVIGGELSGDTEECAETAKLAQRSSRVTQP